MSDILEELLGRQFEIARGEAEALPLPRFDTYTICNLRGGIGKTSLAFNLAYLADEILAVDTCPQCNLSWFFDNNYLQNVQLTVYDLLLPHFVPGLGSASRIAKSIAATNDFFEGKRAFYLPSDNHLYILPSQIATAMVQAQRMAGSLQESIIDAMLFSLRDDIRREMQETGTKRCIIDTSPFPLVMARLRRHDHPCKNRPAVHQLADAAHQDTVRSGKRVQEDHAIQRTYAEDPDDRPYTLRLVDSFRRQEQAQPADEDLR